MLMPPRLGAPLEQLASNEHAADLLGAGADLVELRIAQQAAGGVVVRIPVAAQPLDRFERGSRRMPGSEENAARRIAALGRTRVTGARHGVDIRTARIQRAAHVRHLRLHELESPY